MISSGFFDYYSTHEPLCEDLYRIVYHFFKSDIKIDADNLSKPIWDCLGTVLFDDDKRVKMRIAGSFDLSDSIYDFKSLDFSGLSGKLITALLAAFETEDHVLYIECGTFAPDMIQLNMNRNAN